MGKNQMKKIAINILLIMLFQILLNIAIPIKAFAEEEQVTIQFKDEAFYNGMIGRIGETKIVSKDDDKMTIVMTKANIETINRIVLREKEIKDITGIEKFTNLTYLNLAINQISDISALENLTNLTSLYLESNQISDISVLENLTNLTSLNLGSNPISDISVLSNMTNLTTLYLYNDLISDISVLENLTNLATLYLDNNQINDISALKNLTNLTDLGLSNNQISDISVLKNMTNLWRLYLGLNQISDISALANLTNLTDLYLYENQITKEVSKGRIQEIELPQIITEAKRQDSKIYTDADYILENCELTSDGKKITIDTSKVGTASIKIGGGNASGTTFTINVVKDTTPPVVSVKKSIETLTNQNVTVTITADEEIQKVEGWDLSEGKTILTKEYIKNGEETVKVKDLAGNETPVKVVVNNIDKDAPKLTVTTSTKEVTNKDVTVTITADEEIQIVEGWTLSEDKKVLTKTYKENKTETVVVKDLAGNKTVAKIKITNIDKTVSKDPLADTGKISSFIIFAFIIICAVIFYKKYNKYRDIK